MFDSLSIAKRALAATSDQILMGYRLLITLRHPSTEQTELHTEIQTTPVTDKIINEPTIELTTPNATIIASNEKLINGTPSTQQLLSGQLTDIFLKDLKNRIAGPAIHDFLKSARLKRLEKDSSVTNTPEHITNDDHLMQVDIRKSQDSILPSLGKLPRFKRKQKPTVGKREYESFLFNSASEAPPNKPKDERAETPVSATSSSSEEGEYHSGPESVSDTEKLPARGRKPGIKNQVENRPRRLRDYLSEEESSVDEHDAFLKQLHRQEEEENGQSDSEDDFVENDPFEDSSIRKRKRTLKKSSSNTKKQKKALIQLHSDDDTSEYDFQQSKLKMKQKGNLIKKKKSVAPPLPDRIYEVIEEDLSKDSSSGFEEDDEEEEEENEMPMMRETVDQAELERSLLASDESDSEELAEPVNDGDEPPCWNPFNSIQDAEDYCFLRSALLERAENKEQGNTMLSINTRSVLIH